MSSASSYDPEEDVAGLALKQMDEAQSKNFEKLLSSNRDWWGDYWSKSFIHIHSSDGVADMVEKKLHLDFGSNAVTGIHILTIEKLREYFGLEKHPVKVIEPYQMLGEVEPDLLDAMGVDVIGLWGKNNMFGIPQEN